MLPLFKKHILSTLALILILWSTSLFIIELAHQNDPITTNQSTLSEDVYGLFPAYDNILYRPLVAFDSLFANPDNDPDGPAFFAFFLFPALAILLSGIEAFRHRNIAKNNRFPMTIFIAAIAIPLLMLLIEYLARLFN
jgi:hypothetical protein